MSKILNDALTSQLLKKGRTVNLRLQYIYLINYVFFPVFFFSNIKKNIRDSIKISLKDLKIRKTSIETT